MMRAIIRWLRRILPYIRTIYYRCRGPRIELTGIDRHGIVHRTLWSGDQRPRCRDSVLLDKLGDDKVTCTKCKPLPKKVLR